MSGSSRPELSSRIAQGVEHFNARRFGKAVACFSAALRLDARDPQARYFLAHALSCAPLSGKQRRRVGSLLGPPRDGARHPSGPKLPEAIALATLAFIRAKVRSGRFEAAFREAKDVLDADSSADTIESLLSLPEAPGAPLDGRSSRELLDMVSLYARNRPADPWPRLAKAYLHYRLSHVPEALRATEGMPRLPPRYGWMRSLRGKIQLHFFCAYRDAQREFRAALRSAPSFWQARAYLAEAGLCRGDRRALDILGGLVCELTGSRRANALAWRGEVLLWLLRSS